MTSRRDLTTRTQITGTFDADQIRELLKMRTTLLRPMTIEEQKKQEADRVELLSEASGMLDEDPEMTRVEIVRGQIVATYY